MTTDETVKILICIFKCQSRAKLCFSDVTLLNWVNELLNFSSLPRLSSHSSILPHDTSLSPPLHAEDNLFLSLLLSISCKNECAQYNDNTVLNKTVTLLFSQEPEQSLFLLNRWWSHTAAPQPFSLIIYSQSFLTFYIFFVSSYLFCRCSFHFFLYLKNLPCFKAQSSKHQQEQHQQHHGQTRFDSHEAPTLPTALYHLSCRWERPAGNQIRRLGGVVRTSTFIYKKHLWERISLVTAHDVSPSDMSCLCIWLRCTKEVWTY